MSPSSKEIQSFFSRPCDCIMAAAEALQIEGLESTLPEVAFWGRSNVGKSTLINAVMGRKGLARTSNTPGRTQQIVFFNLDDQLLFADLPGYGHAKAPKKDIEKWNRLIEFYLSSRAQLRCVFLLIDGRHGPLANDEKMMSYLDSLAVNYQIVLTKADQVKKGKGDAALNKVQASLKKHPAARPDILLTSGAKSQGIEELRKLILECA